MPDPAPERSGSQATQSGEHLCLPAGDVAGRPRA
ncbi:MAG: hypothetical protein AVDCRST_MAG57-3784 [uncultured Blastococcus sp.]|uniref:Uncharacterized protein n=1 Tax=uncultured Blastococcus sp. TaxID=217144 RepID=A0A6J4JH92_9ACTN|nr:MAG: hypothetical protein AVDCRST_MAG57-3784 [uncultured Blastococcus sp.]